MKRGEVWTVSGASGYGSKPRPALVVQSDLLAEAHSLVTCGLTTELAEDAPHRPLLVPSPGNGLRKSSVVMVDKLYAIPRRKFGIRVGALSSQDMERVDEALFLVLGLSDPVEAQR